MTGRNSFILSALLLAAGVNAQVQNKPQQPDEGAGRAPGEHHRGPPPEALDACKSLAAGAACAFTGPRGAMTGRCWAPEGKPLACRPNDRPGSGNEGAANSQR